MCAEPDFWIQHTAVDDGFYYAQLAWNWSQGHGLTMDGLNATNGFHPLWLLLLTLLGAVFQTKMGYLFAAVWVSLLIFYVGAGVFGLTMGRLFKSRGLGAGGFLLYLCSPYLFRAHMSLLETGVLLALKMGALYLVVRLLEPGAAGKSWRHLMLGVVCALIFLARVDSFVFTGAVVLAAMAAQWGAARQLGGWRGLGKLADFLLLFLLPWYPTVMAWLVWNKRTFGSFVQISAKMSSYRPLTRLRLFYDFDSVPLWHYYETIWDSVREMIEKGNLGYPVWIFALTSVLALGVVRWYVPERTRKTGLVFWCVANASLLILFLIHFFGRNVARGWYFADVQWILCFSALACAAGWRRHWIGRLGLTAVVVSLSVAWWPVHARWYKVGAREDGPAALNTYSYLCTEIPDATLPLCVGHTDSGVYTFFAPPEVTVVNLDGKVNNAAAAAILSGTLSKYILSSPVEYCHFLHPPYECHMGRGFRKEYQFRGPAGARVLRKPGEAEKNVRLPQNGMIWPAKYWCWPYLLGEWELPEEPYPQADWCRAVRDPGVQFYLPRPIDVEFTVRLKPPAMSGITMQQLSVNGKPLGDIAFDGDKAVTARVTLSGSLLEKGMNQITLSEGRPVSPRMAGEDPEDGSVTTAEVRYFRVVPAHNTPEEEGRIF